MTLADYIAASLRLTGILGENDNASPEQGADGLIVFNDMIGAMRGDGIELGIAPQASTTATLLIPEEDRLHLKHVLAVHLAMNYGRSPSPEVAGIADRGYSKWLRIAAQNDKLTNNAVMPLGRNGYSYNIETGQ